MSRLLRLRSVRAAALAAVAGVAIRVYAASPFPSSAVFKPGEYFDEVLVEKPNGVYEVGDRLFAIGRVPQDDSPLRSKAAASAAATRELRKWAVAKSDEVSPRFPKEPGLVEVLRIHRAFFSNSDAPWMWRNSGTAQVFQNDGDEEYVYALCVKKEDVLASLPVPGTGDGLPGNWSDYLRSAVNRRYAKNADPSFLLLVAAPDAPLARMPMADFPATNGVEECAAFLRGEVSSNPFGKPFEAADSFKDVQRQLADDLPKSWVATSVRERTEAFQRAVAAAAAAATNATAAATNTTAVAGNAAFATPKNNVGPSTTNLASVAGTSVTNMPPPTLLACERMLLSAGRWHVAPEADPSFGKLAMRAFAGKAPLEDKRDRLWALLADHPGEADAWNLLGRILREKGERPCAVACFRCAIRLNPAHEFAWANLSVTYRDMGHGDLAIAAALIARGLASDPWCVRETEAILTSPHLPAAK